MLFQVSVSGISVICKFTSVFHYCVERVVVDGRSKSSAFCPECVHVGTTSYVVKLIAVFRGCL
jgi:hypothetical protein